MGAEGAERKDADLRLLEEIKARAVFQLACPILEFVCIYHFQDVGDGHGGYWNIFLGFINGPR